MRIEDVIVRRVGSGEDAARWAAALTEPAWQDRARTLKQEGAAWVRRAAIAFAANRPPREIVVKCLPMQRTGSRLKRMLHATRGDRQWRGARWLLAHGFAAAEPLLLADAAVDGVPSELLVSEFVDAASVLEHLHANALSVRQQHKVAAALAELLFEQLRAGRYNRDCKPSNLLVLDPETGPVEIATIDTVAIRRVGFDEDAKLARMLATLVIETIGSGVEPRRTLKARVVHEVVTRFPHERTSAKSLERPEHAAALELWREVAEIVRKHGDPRPRVNPLAEHNAP